jgi:hypothetical protein
MALKSLKSLRPAAASAEEEAPEPATAIKTLKPLGAKKLAPAEETPEPESAVAEGPKKLKPLGSRTTLATSTRAEAIAEVTDDEEEDDEPALEGLEALDRSGLKAHIREQELDITVKKSMSDNDIRSAIRAATAPALVLDGEEEEEPAPEPEVPKKPALKKLGQDNQLAKTKAALATDDEEAATDTSRAVAIPAPTYQLGVISGEVDEDDVSRPRLEFAQSIGPLIEEHNFSAGQVVLAKELVLWEKGYDPLSLIVTSANKRFVEKVEYGGDVMPRIFNTAAEVREAGLWTEWVDNEAPPVDKELVCLVLIQQPNYIEPHPMFNIELADGTAPWAIAEMRLRGWGYRDAKAGKYLMTMNRSTLAKGMHLGVMALTAPREKKTKNTVTIPTFKLARMCTPEELEGITRLLQPA